MMSLMIGSVAIPGQHRRVDEQFWIQGIFKDQACRFLIDGSATGLTSGWTWCAAVASPCGSAERCLGALRRVALINEGDRQLQRVSHLGRPAQGCGRLGTDAPITVEWQAHHEFRHAAFSGNGA
jgi:hypothetical protein